MFGAHKQVRDQILELRYPSSVSYCMMGHRWTTSAQDLCVGVCVLCVYICVCLEELLVPALPENAEIERGYVTPQQVYNLLNAEAGEPALHDPYYILILDCRSADRYHILQTCPKTQAHLPHGNIY